MRGTLGLFGRLLLILVGSVLLLGVASVTIILVHNDMHRRHIPTFSRIHQAAGLIDLATEPGAPSHDALLRAANGSDMSAAILSTSPELPGLRPAFRLTAKLRTFMRSRTPVAAFINPRYSPSPKDSGIEGYLAGATARLPDGRVLVLTTNATGNVYNVNRRGMLTPDRRTTLTPFV